MDIIRIKEGDDWLKWLARPAQKAARKKKAVTRILEKVRKKGDSALFKYARKWDGVRLDELKVTGKEISDSVQSIDPALATAILQAKQHIERFHETQLTAAEKITIKEGIICWRETRAIEKVGLYIPGGSAPLFSTVLMLGVPAKLAGCKNIVLCTPANKEGKIHPAILYAASLCGITEIFRVGGAQAIAAMTYGTKTIPAVQKIFGPGNSYVTLAKQLVQEDGMAIDMPAGPSEVLVIADDSADPAFVAADLLSQAEHGPDSQVILLTTEEWMATKVNNEIEKQLQLLPRKKIAVEALRHSRCLVLPSMQEAFRCSNEYAPEHLILAMSQYDQWLPLVQSAGSVFLGHYSPESAGDYASGTNHTLPTNGFARAYSGVSVDSFVKKITFQELTKEGLKDLSTTIMTMASAEGLDAHKEAVAIRLKD